MFALVLTLIVVFMGAYLYAGMTGGRELSFGQDSYSVGLAGVTTTRCQSGYLFIKGPDGSMRQVLDEFGKGARCDSPKRR